MNLILKFILIFLVLLVLFMIIPQILISWRVVLHIKCAFLGYPRVQKGYYVIPLRLIVSKYKLMQLSLKILHSTSISQESSSYLLPIPPLILSDPNLSISNTAVLPPYKLSIRWKPTNLSVNDKFWLVLNNLNLFIFLNNTYSFLVVSNNNFALMEGICRCTK